MVVVGVKTYFIDQFKPSQVRDDQQLAYTQQCHFEIFMLE